MVTIWELRTCSLPDPLGAAHAAAPPNDAAAHAPDDGDDGDAGAEAPDCRDLRAFCATSHNAAHAAIAHMHSATKATAVSMTLPDKNVGRRWQKKMLAHAITMVSRTDTMAIVALVVSTIALVVALYTQFTVKKTLDETVRKLSWSWKDVMSGMMQNASAAWSALPQQTRDTLTQRATDAYGQGMAQLETVDPVQLIGRIR